MQARAANSAAASRQDAIPTALVNVANQEITSLPPAIRMPLRATAEETRAQLQQLGGGIYLPVRDGDTALSIAVIANQSETVAALLCTGTCNMDQADADGLTPLLLAASLPDGDILSQLLRAGADPNVRSPLHGATALMAAATSSRNENVTLLLEAGADVTINTRAGWTALGVATDGDIKTQLRAAYAKRVGAHGM